MNPLANRGTRLKLLLGLLSFVTLSMILSIFGIDFKDSAEMIEYVKWLFDTWVNFAKWIFGIYATSEIGTKGAEAYRDKAR